MKIIERVPVPTGDILIVEGEKGKLEIEGRITCGNAILSGTRPFDLG